MIAAEFRQMLYSFLRVFVASAGAAFLATEGDVFSFDSDAWKSIAAAGISAVVLTAVNFFRPGEEKFGVGSGTVDIDDFYDPADDDFEMPQFDPTAIDESDDIPEV